MLLKDLRLAWRTLLNSPGYALVAMLSLALGIGANSTIFSLADGLLLRPLAVAEPGEVVTIRGVTPNDTFAQVSYPDYRDIRDNTKAFEGVVAFQLLSLGYAESPDALAQVKTGMAVSGNLFDVLGVQPQIGRFFRPDEDQVPGRDAVAVLSHDLWRENLKADPNILNRKIRLNGVEFTVIGVTPEEFTGMSQLIRPALYVPLHMTPSISQRAAKALEDRDARSLWVRGRLRDGVNVKQAEAELTAIAGGLAQTHPKTNAKYSLVVRTELQQRIEHSPPDAMLVAIMLGMVALVLMIACANVTNLMLSRARARSREMAVRLALGASRFQLMRQLLTESLLIAVGGAALGLGMAYWGVAVFGQIQVPTELPIILSFRLDTRVLLFTLIIAVASAILSGFAPAFQSTGMDLTSAIKAGDQGHSERKRFFGRNALVVMQVAFSVILLICASLMVRGVGYMTRTNPGFRTSHLLTMAFDPSLVRYDKAKSIDYYKRLVEVTREVPGVKSVSLTSALPMGDNLDGFEVVPEGYQFQKGQDRIFSFAARTDENHLQTFGVTLLKGRSFSRTDVDGSPKVAIVNQEFANRYWQGQDPIGKRVQIAGDKDWMEVVGVTETTPVMWIAEPPTPFIYVPFLQRPQMRMRLMVHTVGDSAAMAAPLRAAIRTIDPNQPVYDVRTIESFYHLRVVAITQLIRNIFAAAGVMGLLLSLVGLYGLVSFTVSRRTREIGIRMAIGADRQNVLQMVLRQGLVLSVVGIALGLIGGVGAAKVMESAFQTPAADPFAFIGVPVALAIVTLLATLAPARRASKIDPIKALRWE